MRIPCMLILPVICLLVGCVGEEGARSLPLVAGNPFGTPPPPLGVTVKTPSAATETSVRVDYVGRKLLAANPAVGVRPYFLTIGQPSLEVFHLDTKAVYMTEGLVKMCKTEEELAAVLANELGKMIAEREILASADKRNPANLPLEETTSASSPQPTGFVDLVKKELEYPPRPRSSPRPNSQAIAGTFLEKAGYARASLAQVQPILDQADLNCALERQVKGLPPVQGWTP